MKKTAFVLVYALLLSGCASFGKGITEAVLESQTKIDSRVCEIWGHDFSGIQPYLHKDNGKMKVLMIHGVGDHLPGYATEFAEKLAKELDLSVMSKRHKDIALTDPADKTKKLGNLRIQRFLNDTQNKELLFYELSWSEITAKQKEVLAYDNSGEYSFRRAKVNDLLKKFSNDTGPDPIIYLSKSKNDMLTAFVQSFCWMTSSGGWEELPKEGRLACDLTRTASLKNIENDHYAFVAHSLGSRITIDGLQLIAEKLSQQQDDLNKRQKLAAVLQTKHLPIYMMSNQLPMLQLGRELPDISNQSSAYCQPKGAHYQERILAKTSIIAFSDPNDLLSFAIPDSFLDNYLDSRLCAEVTNININIATVFDAFGLGEIANPLEAHIGYDTDDRVVALIAKGIGNDSTAEIVKKRCRWIKTLD